MKIITLIALLLSVNCITFCHAQITPAKTIKEKNDLVKQKSKTFIAKVKSSTSWNYELSEGSATKISHKYVHREFDKTGNLTSVSYYEKDSLKNRFEYTYSSINDLTSEAEFASNGTLIRKNTYLFDKEGRMQSGVTLNWRNEPSFTFVNKFNKTTKTIELTKFGRADSLATKTLFKYKDDFDKWDYIEAVESNAKGVQIQKIEKLHNFQKQLTEKKITGITDNDSYSFAYKYDQKNNLLETLKKNKDGKTEWKETYSYEDRGNLYEETKYDASGNVISIIRYTYEFYK